MDKRLSDIVSYLGEYKIKGDEIIPKYCPICNGGQHRDQETFALNIETGAFNCMRGSCNQTGGLYQLEQLFGIQTEKENYFREYRKPKKVYVIPEKKPEQLSEHTIKYFEARGIKKYTLIANGVKSDKYNNAIFEFYDENNKLAFIKYKLTREQREIKQEDGSIKKEQKSWREKNTKPILYGMNQFVDNGKAIICEGEPDKLIIGQCGFSNVLSIPSGTNDFDWVEHCWEYLERFSEITIWVDNDKAGKELQSKLIAKFDDWKLKVVKSECKDANELYLKYGETKVKEAINKSETVKKSNITDVADIKRNRNRTKYPTGFKTLDNKLGGFYGGQLIVWTGYNGGGKSTFISQLLLNQIEQGHKVFAYSGELPKEDFKEILDFQATGKKRLSSEWCEVKEQNLPSLKPEYDDYLDEWYRGMMFLFDTENYATETEMLKAMEYMAKRENVKTFLIDNMLTTVVEGRESELEKQTKFINTLKRFARKHDAVVHLVAHPRKPEKGQHKVDKYSISGTANISNLADRVLAVHRLKEKDYEENPDYTGKSSLVMVFKDRKFGAIDFEMATHYDFYSKRFYENDTQLNYEYGWVRNLLF